MIDDTKPGDEWYVRSGHEHAAYFKLSDLKRLRLFGVGEDALLERAPPDTIALALVGQSHFLVDDFLRGLSESHADAVRASLDHHADTAPDAGAQAQETLTEAIRHLIRNGLAGVPYRQFENHDDFWAMMEETILGEDEPGMENGSC